MPHSHRTVEQTAHCRIKHGAQGPVLVQPQVGAVPTVVDPVCGMTVDPLTPRELSQIRTC
jgi:hypothetical protein